MQLYSFSYLTSHLIFACADSGKVSKRFMFAICGVGVVDLIPAVISSKASALHKCKKHFILFFRNGCKLITLKKFKFNVNAVQKS